MYRNFFLLSFSLSFSFLYFAAEHTPKGEDFWTNTLALAELADRYQVAQNYENEMSKTQDQETKDGINLIKENFEAKYKPYQSIRDNGIKTVMGLKDPSTDKRIDIYSGKLQSLFANAIQNTKNLNEALCSKNSGIVAVILFGELPINPSAPISQICNKDCSHARTVHWRSIQCSLLEHLCRFGNPIPMKKIYKNNVPWNEVMNIIIRCKEDVNLIENVKSIIENSDKLSKDNAFTLASAIAKNDLISYFLPIMNILLTKNRNNFSWDEIMNLVIHCEKNADLIEIVKSIIKDSDGLSTDAICTIFNAIFKNNLTSYCSPIMNILITNYNQFFLDAFKKTQEDESKKQALTQLAWDYKNIHCLKICWGENVWKNILENIGYNSPKKLNLIINFISQDPELAKKNCFIVFKKLLEYDYSKCSNSQKTEIYPKLYKVLELLFTEGLTLERDDFQDFSHNPITVTCNALDLARNAQNKVIIQWLKDRQLNNQ